MNEIAASPLKKQAEFSQTQKHQRNPWRHAQPWHFRATGQGRKYRLVCWRERHIAKLIAGYAAKSGYCWASVATLASQMGLSRAQTARYLARLEEQGIVVSKGFSQNGTKVIALNPSGLASEPANHRNRPSINSYGLKKGLSCRPAYGPVRESESPTCANVREKSFLRESSTDKQEYAVPEEPTCELSLAISPKQSQRPRGRESRSDERRSMPKSTIPQKKQLNQNLQTYIARNHFETIAAFLRYDPNRWGTREEWKAKTDEQIREWRTDCEYLGYEVDFHDPSLCLDFLDILQEEVMKRRHCETTPARICMKILDRCQRETPMVLIGPGFLYQN